MNPQHKNPNQNGTTFSVDDHVHVLPLDSAGRILAPANNGRYMVEVRGKAWELDHTELRKLDRPATPDVCTQIGIGITYHGQLDTSSLGDTQRIDLHGLRVKDALTFVERVLDQAMLRRLTYIDIVHGIGTGKLQKALHQYLTQKQRNDLIERYEQKPMNPGETRVFF